ncbi:MAG: alpha/beta hydrolase [Candidatus Binataceae bacterium]
MSLDPQMQAFLDQMKAAGAKPLRAPTAALARETFAELVAVLGQGPREQVAKLEDRKVAGPGGQIPLRIYTPAQNPPTGVLMWFHGGGWVLGDLESHDPVCRALASGSGCATVSVDYRLAPENKFPAAAEDCFAATKWAAENLAAFGAPAGAKLAVAGDSAGGNLAAAVALMARDRGAPKLAFQLLVYPAIDAADDTPSQMRFAEDGYILSRLDMEWFWGHYLKSPADRDNPYACPNHAKNLAGLAPALVITAGYDPLCDEGEAYANQIKKAGVAVTLTRYPGVTHGFFSMAAMLDEGKRAQKEACAALRTALK